MTQISELDRVKISELPDQDDQGDPIILTDTDSIVIVRRNPQTGLLETLEAKLPEDLSNASITSILERLDRLEEGGSRPRQEGTVWAGVSQDREVTAAELTVSSDTTHALSVPMVPAGMRRFLIFGKPATEPDFTTALWYPPNARSDNNQFNAFEQLAGTVTKNGVELKVIVSRIAFRGPINDPSVPNSLRILEAN